MAEATQTNETQVSWMVEDIEVFATLARPQGSGPFPAVILVAGSGPTDRDWNTPAIATKNGSGALIARALTAAGFVTLRYDKRASGPHLQENMMRLFGKISMEGHRLELAGGVELLSGRPEVDPARVFALTNSEGCIHALNYQVTAPARPFTGLVLTSAPARAIGDVARTQIAAQVNPLPGGDQMMAAYDRAIADFTAGRLVDVDDSLPEGLRQVILAITNPINQPFAGQLWSTDPAQLLARVDQPVLLVLGKKDIQVDWQLDGPIFEEIANRKSNVELVYIENANHVLKYEPKPLSQLNAAEVQANYNADTIPLDASAVEVIVSWLRAHS